MSLGQGSFKRTWSLPFCVVSLDSGKHIHPRPTHLWIRGPLCALCHHPSSPSRATPASNHPQNSLGQMLPLSFLLISASNLWENIAGSFCQEPSCSTNSSIGQVSVWLLLLKLHLKSEMLASFSYTEELSLQVILLLLLIPYVIWSPKGEALFSIRKGKNQHHSVSTHRNSFQRVSRWSCNLWYELEISGRKSLV